MAQNTKYDIHLMPDDDYSFLEIFKNDKLAISVKEKYQNIPPNKTNLYSIYRALHEFENRRTTKNTIINFHTYDSFTQQVLQGDYSQAGKIDKFLVERIIIKMAVIERFENTTIKIWRI